MALLIFLPAATPARRIPAQPHRSHGSPPIPNVPFSSHTGGTALFEPQHLCQQPAIDQFALAADNFVAFCRTPAA
jgi:hypothetical protein